MGPVGARWCTACQCWRSKGSETFRARLWVTDEQGAWVCPDCAPTVPPVSARPTQRPMKLPSTAWQHQVWSLREQHPDMTGPEIARRLGKHPFAVWRVLNPERALEQSRENERRRSKRPGKRPRPFSECEVCRGRCSQGARLCMGCRSSIAETKQSIVEGCWTEGWTVREIASALGYGPNSTPPMLQKLRERSPR